MPLEAWLLVLAKGFRLLVPPSEFVPSNLMIDATAAGPLWAIVGEGDRGSLYIVHDVTPRFNCVAVS